MAKSRFRPIKSRVKCNSILLIISLLTQYGKYGILRAENPEKAKAGKDRKMNEKEIIGALADLETATLELRDGTSDVLYRLHLHHKTGKGWYLAFGIDYLPNHERVTQWHESVADCWRENAKPRRVRDHHETHRVRHLRREHLRRPRTEDVGVFRRTVPRTGREPRRAENLTKPKRRIRPPSAEGRQPPHR